MNATTNQAQEPISKVVNASLRGEEFRKSSLEATNEGGIE